jgi:serine protease AprX
VSAYYAIDSQAENCANSSLDIAKDLSEEEHFYGPANINDNGEFYVEGLGENYVWQIDQEQLKGDALIWKMGFNDPAKIEQDSASTDALIWKMDFETDALIWKMSLESNALIWKMNFDENQVATINVNSWVEPQ